MGKYSNISFVVTEKKKSHFLMSNLLVAITCDSTKKHRIDMTLLCSVGCMTIWPIGWYHGLEDRVLFLMLDVMLLIVSLICFRDARIYFIIDLIITFSPSNRVLLKNFLEVKLNLKKRNSDVCKRPATPLCFNELKKWRDTTLNNIVTKYRWSKTKMSFFPHSQ